MASPVPESVFEGFEFSEASNVLLLTLMEETQEDHDQCNGDERLVSMIQSLEAEISSDPVLGQQRYEMGQVDGHDCSTSPVIDDYNWVDMEVVSSLLPFDDMNAWSPWAATNENDYSDQFSCASFLEQHLMQYFDIEKTEMITEQ